jgi:hypothetical protein
MCVAQGLEVGLVPALPDGVQRRERLACQGPLDTYFRLRRRAVQGLCRLARQPGRVYAESVKGAPLRGLNPPRRVEDHKQQRRKTERSLEKVCALDSGSIAPRNKIIGFP